MIQIAICDDSPYELDEICRITQSYLKNRKEDYTISQFITLHDLQDQLLVSNFEILLLDVKFDAEKTTSIEFAQKLSNISPNVQIIFITNYLAFFPEVYFCNHIYCILKEELEKKLPRAIDVALKNIKKKSVYSEYTIPVIMNRRTKMILVNDTLFLEKNKREIIFKCLNVESYFTKDEIKMNSDLKITTYGSFDEYIPILPVYFIQTHRSYIANLNYVKAVRNNELVLFTGDIIPISRKYRKATLARISELYFQDDFGNIHDPKDK